MTQVCAMTVFPSVQLSYRRLVRCSLLTIAVFLILASLVTNASALSPVPHSTLVFFSNHPIDDDQWTALKAELHRIQVSFATMIPALSGELEVIRGNQAAPGKHAEGAMLVFLDGDCTLLPGHRLFVSGPLGWVPVIDGRIQPLIHVNCGNIVEMLAPLALGMHRSRRDVVMAEAITRVILHEWVHISTQSARHVEHGVTKSQFLVSDLLADDAEYQPQKRARRERKREPGL